MKTGGAHLPSFLLTTFVPYLSPFIHGNKFNAHFYKVTFHLSLGHLTNGKFETNGVACVITLRELRLGQVAEFCWRSAPLNAN